MGAVTYYQSQYWAALLTFRGAPDSIDALSRSLSNARVDLNPHQVDAALFAVRSPLAKGVMLADEVGLGKTIEAALVIAQRWAERRRRVLLILPATLRTQWSRELEEKFFLPNLVLDARSFNAARKSGETNPFDQRDRVVIVSYQFAVTKRAEVAAVAWDLVVIDEAHRLRNVYKAGNKTARALREILAERQKILLTATPLQNSLMELYGIVSFIDPHVFGDEASFREQFLHAASEDGRNAALQQRLRGICQRTLRRQVLEYIRFTARVPITHEFLPTDDEHQLYEEVSAYLQRQVLVALPTGQRALMTMVLRKLLASSTFAIAGTLRTLIHRLEKLPGADAPITDRLDGTVYDALLGDVDVLGETREEWPLDEETPPPLAYDTAVLRDELAELRHYLKHAERVQHNAKGTALLEALGKGFEQAARLGAARKAVVFTESRRTQEYLFDLLEGAGFQGRVVILNGTNTDARSKEILKAWQEQHEGEEIVTGSRQVDMKGAVVEEFRDRAEILIATEAAAEGVNLQFCSLVVNYDLPWNPQRIEQRIGRCHRYGQKHDVVVVNFVNLRNAADKRVYELLAEKFHLFDGVFGASDEVLGALESGVDVERRIAEVYQNCRTPEEIAAAFDKLQGELDGQITDRMAETRKAVLEHFDQEVQTRLGVHHDRAAAVLSLRERRLLALARAELRDEATFDAEEPRFIHVPQGGQCVAYNLDWRQAAERGETFFRIDHPLAHEVVTRALSRELPVAEVKFDYAAHGAPVAILAARRGQRGWLRLDRVDVASVETEQHVALVAVTDAGEVLDHEWCERLLDLPAVSGATVNITPEVSPVLEREAARAEKTVIGEVEARNAAWFDDEVQKLDLWADDMKVALERELKDLDIAIRAARKASKDAVTLSEKLAAQKEIKALENKRHDKRRQLFEAQDDVDKRRTGLIEDIERRLGTKATRETMFTLRWTLI